MNQTYQDYERELEDFPRASGDEPYLNENLVDTGGFSPREWG